MQDAGDTAKSKMEKFPVLIKIRKRKKYKQQGMKHFLPYH